jgi:hypothetical protein
MILYVNSQAKASVNVIKLIITIMRFDNLSVILPNASAPMISPAPRPSVAYKAFEAFTSLLPAYSFIVSTNIGTKIAPAIAEFVA